MRILFYNHTGLFSGAERVLLMICGNLDTDAFTQVMVCPKGDLEKRARTMGLEWIEMDEANLRFTWRPDRMIAHCFTVARKTLAFRRIVSRNAADLIHANSVRAGVIASLATVGMPVLVVWHVHDILKRHPFSTVIRLLALVCGVREVVAVSRATADAFEGLILKVFAKRARVRVVHNGIEEDRFRPDDADRVRKRRELSLADGEIGLGIIGQISPRKGHLELVQAFAEVTRTLPETKLFIAGAPIFHNNGAYFERVQREVGRLGIADRVVFLGQCEDTPSLLRALDLVVVNSRMEPFSLVLLESQACARAVLATPVGGIPELITDGENGFLLKNLDTGHLTQRLKELITNSETRRSAGERGRAHVLARFSSARLVRDFETLYREVSGPYRRPREPAGKIASIPEEKL